VEQCGGPCGTGLIPFAQQRRGAQQGGQRRRTDPSQASGAGQHDVPAGRVIGRKAPPAGGGSPPVERRRLRHQVELVARSPQSQRQVHVLEVEGISVGVEPADEAHRAYAQGQRRGRQGVHRERIASGQCRRPQRHDAAGAGADA